MAEVAFRDRQPFIDMYLSAAQLLCAGGAPQTRGGLNIPGGNPLRRLVIGDQTSARHWLAHEKPQDGEPRTPRDTSAWNLDYTLQTMVYTREGDDTQQQTPSAFIAELCESFGEKPKDASVDALGTTLDIHYEQGWLSYQQRRLDGQAKKHAGKRAQDIDDKQYKDLALDVPLRKAHVASLHAELWGHVRDAHNIARTDYNPLNEMAWMSVTGRGNPWGQPYMSPEAAMDVLGLSVSTATSEEA